MAERALEHQVALVTGAGRGLGRAFAERLAALGCSIAVHGMRELGPSEYGGTHTLTDVATEIPRCRSMSMKSEDVLFRILFDFTAPATWIAPPNSRNFSVSVVLPASGCEMMAKVLLLRVPSRNFWCSI